MPDPQPPHQPDEAALRAADAGSSLPLSSSIPVSDVWEPSLPELVPEQLVDPTDPNVFGNFRRTATTPVGSGATSHVYEGVHKANGRRVAIKVLRPERAHSPGFRERFSTEAKALAGVESQYVVQILDSGEHPSTHELYLVLEWVDGKSLAHCSWTRAGARDRAAITRAVQVVRAVAAGLVKIAEAGFFHGDVKPANILIPQAGTASRTEPTAKLTDLGLARRHGAHVGGTDGYKSPEQEAGETLDSATDVYSLGVVFSELLTGRVVTQSASVFSAVPVPLRSLCRRMLAPEAGARCSVATVGRELDAYLTQQLKASIQRWALGLGAFALGTAVVAAGLFFMLRGSHKDADKLKDDVVRLEDSVHSVGNERDVQRTARLELRQQAFARLISDYRQFGRTKHATRHNANPRELSLLRQLKESIARTEARLGETSDSERVELKLAWCDLANHEGRWAETIQKLDDPFVSQARAVGLGAEAFEVLGDALGLSGNLRGAVKRYDTAVQMQPARRLAEIKAAWCVESLGLAEEAISRFSRCSTSKPSSGDDPTPVVFYCRASARVRLGDTSAANKDFDETLRRLEAEPSIFQEPLSTAALRGRAITARKDPKGRQQRKADFTALLDGARRELTARQDEAIRLAACHLMLWSNEGDAREIQYILDKHAEVTGWVGSVTGPGAAWLSLARGKIRQQLKQFAEAEKDFTLVLDSVAEPRHGNEWVAQDELEAVAFLRRAQCRGLSGKKDGVASDLDRAIRILKPMAGPNNPEGTFDLCLAYFTRAIICFDDSRIVKAPKEAKFLFERGEENLTEAITRLESGEVPLFEPAQQLRARCLFYRVRVLIDLQKHDDCIRDTRRLIVLYNQSQIKSFSFGLESVEIGEVYLYLGRELYNQLKPDANAGEIIDSIEKGLRLTPTNQWHWLDVGILGESHKHLKQWQQAIQWEKKAIELADTPARKQVFQQALTELEQLAKKSDGR